MSVAAIRQSHKIPTDIHILASHQYYIQLTAESQRVTYDSVAREDVHINVEWLCVSKTCLSSGIINTQCTLQNHVQCRRRMVQVLYSFLQLRDYVLGLHTASDIHQTRQCTWPGLTCRKPAVQKLRVTAETRE